MLIKFDATVYESHFLTLTATVNESHVLTLKHLKGSEDYVSFNYWYYLFDVLGRALYYFVLSSLIHGYI